MASEEQILHYYLKAFSIIFFLLIFFFLKLFFINGIIFENEIVKINKNHQIDHIVKNNFKDISLISKLFYINSIKLYNNYYQHIHYGEFIIKNKISFYEFIKTITQPSNTHNKITIVEGWHLYQLNELLDKYFKIYNNLSYFNVIADTYLVDSDPDFNSLEELFKKHKDNLIKKYKNHELLKIYNFDDIIIIASLIEKEGIDDQDKKKISSVIFNRIEKKMKLQIDATVIYSITEGKYKLNRKLSKNDLKIKHEYNTYYHKNSFIL